MKKNVIRNVIIISMSAAMAFGITACSNEVPTTQESQSQKYIQAEIEESLIAAPAPKLEESFLPENRKPEEKQESTETSIIEEESPFEESQEKEEGSFEESQEKEELIFIEEFPSTEDYEESYVEDYEESTEVENQIETIYFFEEAYTAAEFQNLGIIDWGGWCWTYYSQNDMPGEDLPIPGRYVDENGYVCDENGYICLASSSLDKGTLVDTPFGKMGKVYDCGCLNYILDVYVDW